MASAAHLRLQIDAVLAAKDPHGRGFSRLALLPRLAAPGHETGFATLDHLLQAGIPVAGTTEIIGSRSSGRTSFAMAYLAERTSEGHVCAWIDVAGDLAPEAALANGADLDRILWIRCSGAAEPAPSPAMTPALHPAIQLVPVPAPAPGKTAHRDLKGTPGATNRRFGAPPEPRTVQVASDRLPSRRGDLVLHKPKPAPAMSRVGLPQSAGSSFVKPRRPWSRLEQAIKSVDLLIQAGGFGAIVLDLGEIDPQFSRRIPLATWFRWRSALERSRCSLLVLTQSSSQSRQSCTGSAAELILRLEAELPAPGTVLPGLSYRMDVVRRRNANQEPTPRKTPQSTVTDWHSRFPWITHTQQPGRAS